MAYYARHKKTNGNFTLYRYFTGVTLAITFAVAVMAEKDRPGSFESGFSGFRSSESRSRTLSDKPARPKSSSNSFAVTRGFGTSSRFGAPMDRVGASIDSAATLGGVALGPARYVPAEYMSSDTDPETTFSKSEFAALSPEERKELLRRTRLAQQGRSPEARKRAIRAITARAIAGAN